MNLEEGINLVNILLDNRYNERDVFASGSDKEWTFKVNQALQTVIAYAQTALSTTEGLPEKLITEMVMNNPLAFAEAKGYNKGIDDCTPAFAKKEARIKELQSDLAELRERGSEEEIEEILQKHIQGWTAGLFVIPAAKIKPLIQDLGRINYPPQSVTTFRGRGEGDEIN